MMARRTRNSNPETPEGHDKPIEAIRITTRNLNTTQSPLSLSSSVNNRNSTTSVARSADIDMRTSQSPERSLPLSQPTNSLEVVEEDDNEIFHECNSGSDDDNISHSGFSVPRYCRTTRKSSSIHVDMSNVWEDIEETGDGGDSDVEGELCGDLDEAVAEAELERRIHEHDNEIAQFTDRNVTILTAKEADNYGCNIELQKYVPTPPISWTPDIPKTHLDQPLLFEDVDNPGDWLEYAYRPEFNTPAKGGKYKGHFLPTGATPVEVNADGNRICGGWTFHYSGWENETEYKRSDVTDDELFPQSRKGCLDGDILERLGLTKEKMQMGDALFFLQLLLPICDPKKSGVTADPRLPFYSEVVNHSNLYACSLGLVGGQYSHAFKPIKVHELVHWDGVLVRDGALGGSNGALYQRWMVGETMYDAPIYEAIGHDRFLQIKRTIKLCNNYSARNKGDAHYNPAYKYDLIFKVLVHNCNAITKYADLDLCGDETTFAHMGYGEANTGLLRRLGQMKPGVTRGMQTVMVFDVGRIRPRAYVHRHKCHPNPNHLPQGCNELMMCLNKLNKMVIGNDGNNKKIFKQKPHITWDNFFSGDTILDWIGRQGFGTTMTCRRDRLPSDIKGMYLHKKKTDTSPRTKVARFMNPIVAVKTNETYQRVHVSFQSTSSCNITTVNAMSACNLSLRSRERGALDKKRKWVIEMNNARALYLATYGVIDNVDKLVKYTRMQLCSWKYWHAAMLHAKKIACVVAYDIYRECCEGNLNPLWKVSKPLSFWQFRDKLGLQMLSYSPKFCYYAGDERMRTFTAMSKNARSKKRKRAQDKLAKRTSTQSVGTRSTADNQSEGEVDSETDYEEDVIPTTMDERVTVDQLKAMKSRKNSRLCGNMKCLQTHVDHIKKIKCAKACEVCGVDTYTVCTLCPNNPGVHFFPVKGIAKGKSCFLDFHSDEFFGLAKSDTKLFHDLRLIDWKPPTVRAKKSNAKYITDMIKNNNL